MRYRSLTRAMFGLALFLFLFGSAFSFDLPVQKKTLKNGMTILVLENHTAPVVSTYLRFKVGSVDEHPGITGTSHLLEHMMFKGTKDIGTANYKAELPVMEKIDQTAHQIIAEQARLQNPLSDHDSTKLKALREQLHTLQAEEKKYVIKDELWETYLKNGGTGLNASTSEDGTQYFVSLPANRLELWAFLESDRIANPILREFYSERDVVYEERRLRTDTQPFGKLSEQFGAAAYIAHPYGWPVVGWASDLETVSREEVEKYFRRYYAPNNAIAVIVGDVKAPEVFALMEKYFAPIPPQPAPDPVFTTEPPQEGERRVKAEFDANPLLLIGWHIPALGNPDWFALDVLSDILSQGRTSRLYKKIVEEKKLATNISSFLDDARYPGLFYVQATPLAPHMPEEVEQAVYAEIERAKNEPVTDWELQKVKNQTDAALVRSLQSNNGLAFVLGNTEAITGDWKNFITFAEKSKQVTPEQIQQVAKQYLTESNRTVGILVQVKGKKVEPPKISPGSLKY